MSSEKSSALRTAGAAPAPALSPIVPLLPTGYRDIQPFQRGQGWHTNGKATARLRHAREASDRVVFPLIPTHNGAVSGPTASVVDGYDRLNGTTAEPTSGDDDREREEAERRATSPPVSAIPVPPPASKPRRPNSGPRSQGNQRTTSGSFRTRAIAAAVQGNSNGVLSPTSSISGRSGDEEESIPPPDPATMEKLWQEYNERTRHPTRTVDRETYHRKMHHRYNENKALKDRIIRLESELEEAQRERDEALEESRRLAEGTVGNSKWKDADLDDSSPSISAPRTDHGLELLTVGATSERLSPRRESSKQTFASVVSRLSTTYKLQQSTQIGAVTNLEETSYRERCFKLERTMAAAKEGVAQLQARLLAMHTNDHQTIETLQAKLELEQQASKVLSVQLRETNAAFRSAADELVTTQVALEKEQIEKQIIVEQIQAETRQLISDQKRKELQSRVKNVVRTLGKEALHQKMEALHTRVIAAEHHMRVSQLEVVRLKKERDQQQQRLDEILSSREIKYHCLASKDGGIPGILRHATTLFQGARTMNEQYLMVHILYEDNRSYPQSNPNERSNQSDHLSDLEDGYCIHIIVYDAFSAQDDYLTFHLRDIRRLVADAEKYLATLANRKLERFRELAEILYGYCQVGYKNGHIVITERPVTVQEAAANERSAVVIYRGSRYLETLCPEHLNPAEDILTDLAVNEVCNPATSQLWWLEIHANAVDFDNQEIALHLTIDNQVLKTLVPSLSSYRPSETLHISKGEEVVDECDVFGIHEELLEVLFAQIKLRRVTPRGELDDHGELHLVLTDVDGISILCGGDSTSESVEVPCENEDREQEALTKTDVEICGSDDPSAPPTARVLDHRSIVCVNGTFYCVRIQEVWDGELMLRVTMEEPDDSTARYESVILEHDIAAIASHLHKSGACEEDYAASVKYGLPLSLHDSMCRILKKHVKPIPGSSDTNDVDRDLVTRRISFDSLHSEMQCSDPVSECSIGANNIHKIVWITLQGAVVIGARRVEQVGVIGDDIGESQIQHVIDSIREGGNEFLGRKQRIAGRFKTISLYAMAIVRAGFPAPLNTIVVIDLHVVGDCSIPSLDSPPAPDLIVANIPVSEALDAFGFRASTAN